MKIQGNRTGSTWPGQCAETLAPVTVMMAFLHLEAGHDLVAPCDSEQRRRNEWYLYWVYKMTLLHDNTTKWVAIGCKKTILARESATKWVA